MREAFTANARQAEELLNLAKEHQVFITEAIWTATCLVAKNTGTDRTGSYRKTLYSLCQSGICHSGKERIIRPELAGGALLDIGVYTLNFAAMTFGTDIEDMSSACRKTETGVDGQENITLFYKDGKMASLQASIYAQTDRMGVISGDKGHLIVENINNPQSVRLVDSNYNITAVYHAPAQITGYEYEVYAAIEALENGWLESPYMLTLKPSES